MQKIPGKFTVVLTTKFYNREGERWWQTDFSTLIRTLINPSRVGYVKKIIEQVINMSRKK